MPSKVFTDMLRDAAIAGADAKTKESREWFRRRARDVRKADTLRLMADSGDRFRQSMHPGSMYLFTYDPKHKDTLPYYDTYPLIFPLAVEKDYILGLNFHYLPPKLRAQLLDALYEHVSNPKMDKTTRMRVTYGILKSASKYSLFKPCIKKYLKKHVRSRFIKIEPNEWDFTIMLNLDAFQKVRREKVWAESRRKAGY